MTLTTRVDKGKRRDISTHPIDIDGQRMDSGGNDNDNTPMDTSIDFHHTDNSGADDRMDVDVHPVGAVPTNSSQSLHFILPPLSKVRTVSRNLSQSPRIIVSSSTSKTPKQGSTLSSGTLTKPKNTKRTQKVVRASTLNAEGLLRSIPFPTGIIKPKAAVNLKVGKGSRPAQELPVRTLFCAKGTPHEIVFRAHVCRIFVYIRFRLLIDAVDAKNI